MSSDGNNNNSPKKSWLEIITAIGILLGGAAALVAALLGGDGISSLFQKKSIDKKPEVENVKVDNKPQVEIDNQPNVNIDNKPQVEIDNQPNVKVDNKPQVEKPITSPQPNVLPLHTASKSWCLSLREIEEIGKEVNGKVSESSKALFEENNCSYWDLKLD